MKPTVTIPVISFFLVLVFGYTAFSKLANTDAFEATLERTPFIRSGAAVLAPVIPSAELVIVLLLLFPRTRLWGLYASGVLLSLFTSYLVVMLLFAPKLPCSCGGVISGMGWWEHVGFNIFFLGLAIVGIWNEKMRVASSREEY